MNWARFFDMGGYAFYVWSSFGLYIAAEPATEKDYSFYIWGSFGVALALMAAEVLLLRRRKRALLRQVRQADKVQNR